MFCFPKISATTVLVACLGFPSLSLAAVELSCSTPMMPNHSIITESTMPYFAEITKRSDGAVNFTYFAPGTLVSTPELLNATLKGVVNITTMPLSSASSLFRATTVVDLPMMFNSAKEATLASLLLLEKNELFRAEFAPWMPLALSASAPRQLASVRKPIRALGDLKGLKIATPTPQAGEVLVALGAIPVVLPNNDTYLALQRGMVDACYMPVPFMKAAKVTEVAKYITICNMDYGLNGFLMSRKGFDALPEKVKTEMNRLSPWASSLKGGFYTDYLGQRELQWIVDNHKVEVYTLPTAERELWRENLQPVYQKWMERMKKQGIENPEGLLEATRGIFKDIPDPAAECQRRIESYKEVLGSLYPPADAMK